jgi:hypothetical protein
MSYDAFASTFSQSRKNLHWGEIEYFIEIMNTQFSGKKISILDVGCGNGRFLESLEYPPHPNPLLEGEGPRREKTPTSPSRRRNGDEVKQVNIQSKLHFSYL